MFRHLLFYDRISLYRSLGMIDPVALLIKKIMVIMAPGMITMISHFSWGDMTDRRMGKRLMLLFEMIHPDRFQMLPSVLWLS